MKSPSPSFKSITKSLKSQSPPSVGASNDEEERFIRNVSFVGSTDAFKKSAKRTSSSKRSSIISEDLKQKQTGSKLLLARDSVMLCIANQEKKSMENFVNKLVNEAKEFGINQEKEKVLDKETLQETRFADLGTKSTSSLQLLNGETGKTPSKLALAIDSIELIKSAMSLTDKTKNNKTTPVMKQSVKPTKRVPSKTGKTNKPLPPNRVLPLNKTRKVTVRTSKTIKAVGEGKMQVYQQPPDEFTEERIKSLVDSMKKNPSLIGLFTKCSK